VQDAVAAVRHAAAQLRDVVAIGGDSAGGCVAALAALALRDAGEAGLLAGQFLVCPNTDLTGAHASMAAKGEPGLRHGFVQDAEPSAEAATERFIADVRLGLRPEP
jgi:acetyl esterase/lipase